VTRVEPQIPRFLVGSESPFAPGSPFVASIAHLFEVTLVVCAVIGIGVTVALAYSLVAFRFRGGDGEPIQRTGNVALEVLWTAIPIAIVVGLFVMSVATMARSDPATDRAPDLMVVGHQWWWEVRYPSGVVTANEIHIPAGVSLLVRLESADVIHDFWVPRLARKMDAIPGHPNLFWMSADFPGSYGGTCAEFCGAQHAWMRLLVIAQSPSDFDAWQTAQRAPARATNVGAVARGERTFREQACGNCHAIAGLGFDGRVAPDLTHLGSRATLAAGATDDTREGLTAWLQDPQAIKPGCHMPNFKLSEAKVADLVAFLEALP
jgi:cytochrome c oxidase subunit 2